MSLDTLHSDSFPLSPEFRRDVMGEREKLPDRPDPWLDLSRALSFSGRSISCPVQIPPLRNSIKDAIAAYRFRITAAIDETHFDEIEMPAVEKIKRIIENQ